nr:MAG TPA: hypothetical protein [Caudoviricetes sp.]
MPKRKNSCAEEKKRVGTTVKTRRHNRRNA